MKLITINRNHVQQGFTLVELLIVIAIIGVLAASVLVLIDPIEQIARGEDSGRKTSVSQLGRALQANYTQNGALWMAVTGWTNVPATNTLITAGELKSFPANPNGVTAPCTAVAGITAAVANQYCYKTNGTDAVVYTRMESRTERNKGTCANVANNTWYVWSSFEGRAGIYCGAAEPVPGQQPNLLNF